MEKELVVRKCRECIYFTEIDDAKRCHLTPREREVKDDYWCSHGVWYVWNGINWETHMHGEVVKPREEEPPALKEVRELIGRFGNDPE